MPLLNRKPFKKQKPPSDLKPDEEVFFCEPTKEIFRNYDDFFERMILCNSLLWSCEITGRYGLTYQEAEESERAASTTVNSIQPELKKPLLLICSLMYKTGLKDLVNEVLKFIRDRFFLGENVQIQKDNATWVNGSIRSIKLNSEVQVNGHSEATNGLGHTSDSNGHDNSDDVNGHAHTKFDGGVDTALVRYQVVMKDGTVRSVPTSRVRRDRRAIGYDRLRMLYRQCTRAEPVQNGRIRVRSSVTRRLSLQHLEYRHVFPVGATPVFPQAPAVFGVGGRATGVSCSSAGGARVSATALGGPHAAQERRVFDEQDDTPLSVIKSETKEKWEAERRRLSELRIQERDRRRLRKKQLQDWLKEWSRPREDLLLEDHKELPVFPAVSTRLSPQLLGSVLQLMEFLHNFSSLLDAEDILGGTALSLPFVERALLDNEVAGPFINLLQVLLRAVFTLQAEEDEESGRCHETGLHTASADLLDTLTVTELLRRHLQQGFSSGGEDIGRWRQQQRGGYMDSDCPTHAFRQQHADILHKLSQSHVLYLSPGERMEVLECLQHEILVSVSARDTIDEADNKARELRAQLRTVRSSISALQRSVASDTARIQEWRDSEAIKSTSTDTPASTLTTDPHTLPTTTATTIEEGVQERERRVLDSRQQLSAAESRELQLQEELVAVSRLVSVQPLGRDRAHRRYWLLPSLPALLVQHCPDTGATCCLDRELAGVHCAILATGSTTTSSIASAPDLTAPLRALIADRLCQQLGAAGASLQGGLDELLQGEVDVEAVLSSLYCAGMQASSGGDSEYSRDPAVLSPLLLCTADSTSCPVHSSRLSGGEWSCCSSKEQLEQLVDALNCRGLRETELKHNLKQMEQGILHLLDRCPVDDLLSNIHVNNDGGAAVRDSAEAPSAAFTSGQQTNLNFALETTVSHVEEMVLRDWLLEMEEKVQAGALGLLKVEDRTAWREALLQRSYDQQCDRLSWGRCSSPLQNGVESVSADDEKHCDSSSSHALPAPLPASFSGSEQYELVRSLASALLQVEQGIEVRFLRASLADPDDMKCWEESLMRSSSLSQLFVHLAQLDSSVQWSCSVLNARCKICRKKSDAENMLLCDGCNRGFHLNCLTPRLKNVPEGDWFCVVCKPKMKPKSPVKRRRDTLIDSAERDSDSDVLRHDCIKVTQHARVLLTDSVRRSLPEFSTANSLSDSSKQPLTRKRRGTSELGPDQFDCAALSDLLSSLRNQPGIDSFLRPVKAKEAPQYYRIIREPMDLGTVQKKLNNMGYTTNEQCLADTALVFANCCMYNEKGSDIHTQALKLRRFFNRRLVELGLHRGNSKRSRRSF